MPTFPLLCAMMFLQFFVWGSWYVTAGTFVPAMGWSDSTTAWVYSAGPIAALISPLFLGLIADRYFASQRVLGVMHALGGALMLYVPQVAQAGQAGTFEWLILGYMLCYMPTLGLSNTVAFSHITNPEKQFPLARVFGTLGWIAAVTLVSKGLHADTKDIMFTIAGGSSLVLAALCFLLPHTPPPAAGKRTSLGETLGLGAVELLREPAFAVFLVCSFLICIPLAGYYSFGNQFAAATWSENPGFYMTFGQWAEVAFMLVMPLFFKRLGVKWMLAIGMLAWVVRYGLFSAAAGSTPPVAWMVIGGILLHGICYDFFFVTGQIYVEQKARPEIRGQAQSFLVLVTQGLGMLIGAQVMGNVVAEHTTATVFVEGASPVQLRDWAGIWLFPCYGAAAILLVFTVLFRHRPARPLA